MTTDHIGVMVLASGDHATGMTLLDAADEADAASLLHGVLGCYQAAIRETMSDMGVLAVGVLLEELAANETSRDLREAAALILAHSAAKAPDADSAFAAFGCSGFNMIVTRVDERGRFGELVVAVATVWKIAAPWLHTEAGLEILRRVEW